jgi:hypothetical protein
LRAGKKWHPTLEYGSQNNPSHYHSQIFSFKLSTMKTSTFFLIATLLSNAAVSVESQLRLRQRWRLNLAEVLAITDVESSPKKDDDDDDEVTCIMH